MIRLKTVFSDVKPEILYDVLHDPDYRKVENIGQNWILKSRTENKNVSDLGQAHARVEGAGDVEPQQRPLLLRHPLSCPREKSRLCAAGQNVLIQKQIS